MKRSTLIFIVIVFTLISLLLGGCWSNKELNELAIVLAVGVDKKDDEFVVTVQVVMPKEFLVESTLAPVSTFTASGKSLHEAFAKIAASLPRVPYFSHQRIQIYHESVAKEGILPLLDIVERNQQSRPDFFFLISKDPAEEILQIMTPLEKTPSGNIGKTLRNAARNWGITPLIKRDELIEGITSEGKDVVLPSIKIIGDKEIGKTMKNLESLHSAADIEFEKSAVFVRDRLAGWFNDRESRGYSLTQGRIVQMFINIPCSDANNNIVVGTRNIVPSISSRIRNEKPEVDIKLRVEGEIVEVSCPGLNLDKPETITDIQEDFGKEMKKLIEETIKKSYHKIKADVYGFGEEIRKHHPEAWKSLKDDWHEQLPNLPIHIEIDAKIRRIGVITNMPNPS